MTDLHKQNYLLRREADRMATTKLLNSEWKWQICTSKTICSEERLTELQLHNSKTADNTFKKIHSNLKELSIQPKFYNKCQ